MNINPADIKVDTFKAPNSSAWIRSNDVCVRVTHAPTGIYAESAEQRSQHANRAIAFDKLIILLGSQTDYTKQMELEF